MTGKKVRFLILSQPRTGSSLLGSLLNSHPDIYWASHELKGSVLEKQHNQALWKLTRLYPVVFLEFQARKASLPVYGFKLMYHHLSHPHAIIPHMAWLGWKIVSLHRRDIFMRTISFMVSRQTRVWGNEQAMQANVGRLQILAPAFLQFLEKGLKQQEKNRRMLGQVPHLSLVYEEHLADASYWQETCNRVFEYLGLSIVPVYTNMQKTWGRPYREMIVNYAELVESVRQSPLAAYVPAD